MPQLTVEKLAALCGVSVTDNLRSVFEGVKARGEVSGLLQPHRLAQYLAQLAHESMDFRYDREIWGPTAAQSRYEGRADLGNTQAGDGSKYRGYTATQITGRYNTTAFYQWCLKLGAPVDVPNFVENPALMNTDPWEGLGPIWYWESRNLNRYADDGDVEMVSKIINGGSNGLADRMENVTEISLRMLGYGAGDVRQFQGAASLEADGISGKNTRGALHTRLVDLPAYSFDAVTTPEAAPPAEPVPEQGVHAAVLAIARVRRAVAEYDAHV